MLQIFKQLFVGTLLAPDHRRENLELAAGFLLKQQAHDRRGRLRRNPLAAIRAVRPADPGKEQPEVVGDFGDGADGRARVFRDRFLLNGNRRRQPRDVLDIRLVHQTQKLPRVGGQALHIAALALGINCIKRER